MPCFIMLLYDEAMQPAYGRRLRFAAGSTFEKCMQNYLAVPSLPLTCSSVGKWNEQTPTYHLQVLHDCKFRHLIDCLKPFAP